MRHKMLVSIFAVLFVYSTGCATKKQLENQKQKTKNLKKKVNQLEASVNQYEKTLDEFDDDKRLSVQNLEELGRTVGTLQGRINELETSLKELRSEKNQRIDELTRTNKNLRERNEKLIKTLNTLEKKRSELERKVERLKRKNQSLMERHEKSQSDDSRLLKKKLYFKTGRAEVNEFHKEKLNKIISVLRKNPEKLIVVEGHADTVPITTAPFSSNWDLSAERATAVVEYLTSTSSLDPARFSVRGMGEHALTEKEKRLGENLKLNRRVDIKLVPRE